MSALTSAWGTANATLTDPSTAPLGASAWGTANATLTDPDPLPPGPSAWGTANATLTAPEPDPETGLWMLVDAEKVPVERYRAVT
jgi:hypothetical protein